MGSAAAALGAGRMEVAVKGLAEMFPVLGRDADSAVVVVAVVIKVIEWKIGYCFFH